MASLYVTKNTKAYDGLFKDTFERIYNNEFKNKFLEKNIFMSTDSLTIW